MNPANYLPLILFGAAIVWSVHLAYGSRASVSDDRLKYCMLTGGWIFILGGTCASLASFASGPLLIMVPVFWIIVLATIHRYREAERQSLIWTLAYAAQRGIPLSQAARAFAQERTDEIGSRSWRLADALEAGLPLDVALAASANKVPLNALVAMRFGATIGKLPQALLRAVSESREFDQVLRSMVERIVLMIVAMCILLLVTTFLMLKIVPTFERMFMDFELALPAPTMLLIALAQLFARYWFFAGPFIMLLGVAMFVGLLYYVGWLSWKIPGVDWLRVGYDRTVMLHTLALAVGSEQPLETSLAGLEAAFPTYAMQRRLRRALRLCQQGSDPFTALRLARLITHYEQAVLAAAQRVGNLPWALEVMADTAVRRLTNRIRRVSIAIFTMLFVSFSFLVLLFAVAMISPLASLVLEMSRV